ncbi:hypothetical protein Vafri_9917 [Volvox africanus]|uniref:Uncharacterized protein n=1 Tax=Volvox africanus TaxID=51714 RepID=A0A8J4F1Y8_9CHLO|nr:hypothetical protein Vafri_9917 [Volvox africanus]
MPPVFCRPQVAVTVSAVFLASTAQYWGRWCLTNQPFPILHSILGQVLACLVQVVGHGMNAAELARNPRLEAFFVRDLNREPDGWPLVDQSLDAVLCCVRYERTSCGVVRWPRPR